MSRSRTRRRDCAAYRAHASRCAWRLHGGWRVAESRRDRDAAGSEQEGDNRLVMNGVLEHEDQLSAERRTDLHCAPGGLNQRLELTPADQTDRRPWLRACIPC